MADRVPGADRERLKAAVEAAAKAIRPDLIRYFTDGGVRALAEVALAAALPVLRDNDRMQLALSEIEKLVDFFDLEHGSVRGLVARIRLSLALACRPVRGGS